MRDAIDSEILDIIQIILEKGYNPNVPDMDGKTAFMYAIEKDNIELVNKFLSDSLENDAYLNNEVLLSAIGSAGQTAYSTAMR
jgi:ankyrin repeat protein